jgi:hypothetical protein
MPGQALRKRRISADRRDQAELEAELELAGRDRALKLRAGGPAWSR